ncbi:uncharacterized protein C3orf38 homolog [Rhinoderma darwinii]|uniref:uncharacterized protein C3orf38 homolog n=1 Tax=Rhinoderma darwinii TaxID=43563 RepID=UPI003F66DB27
MPTAFVPFSLKQRQKASATRFSSSLYPVSSMLSPLQDSSKTWNLGVLTPGLDEILSRIKEPVVSPSMPKQENVYDASKCQQLEIVDNSSSCPLSYDISKLSIHSSQEDDRKEQTLTSQTWDSQEADDPSCIWPIHCEKFAKDFCEWFYPLLNSQYPSSGLQNKDWGPQHFLEDAALHLTYMSAKRQYNGGRNASSRLLALIQEDKLIFQPNITNRGVKCERSLKGMVVAVAGTIFRNKSYVGTFDQVFKIVGNTRDNNWKIQQSELKISKISP